jgi:hypothetical protein
VRARGAPLLAGSPRAGSVTALLILALLLPAPPVTGSATSPRMTDIPVAAVSPQIASWYVDRRKVGHYAAMPEYRWGMKPWRVRVCRADRPAVCVIVTVSDACQCLRGTPRARGIDLSRHGFAHLADPFVGLLRVTIRRLS